VSGRITGRVSGRVTGRVSGRVTGRVSGRVTGRVSGRVTSITVESSTLQMLYFRLMKAGGRAE